MRVKIFCWVLGLSLIFNAFAVQAQKIKTEKVRENVYMITGPGGNIGVFVGREGLYVIDDKFARNSEAIMQALKAISPKPVRFVINTHYHGDHSGGNEAFKQAGATILAHENVRQRMGLKFENKVFNRTIEPVSPALWPDMTFTEITRLYVDGQEIRAFHTPRSHTDGDCIVYLTPIDVIHMGDNFFNGQFPYIDVDSGGTLQGMIAAQDRALALAGPNSLIIPGHGALARREDLQRHRDMLEIIRMRLKTHIQAGESLREIIARKPLTDMDDMYGQGFINSETMIRSVYYSITGN